MLEADGSGDGEMESPGGGWDKVMKTVVLFGKSLAVSSIGASLQGCAGLRVLAVNSEAAAAATAHGAAQRLATLRPDVVLFDLATVPSDFAIALWKAQPGTLLIGIDLLADQALVLSGRPARAHTIEDLLHVIRGHKREHGDSLRSGDAGTGSHACPGGDRREARGDSMTRRDSAAREELRI